MIRQSLKGTVSYASCYTEALVARISEFLLMACTELDLAPDCSRWQKSSSLASGWHSGVHEVQGSSKNAWTPRSLCRQCHHSYIPSPEVTGPRSAELRGALDTYITVFS